MLRRLLHIRTLLCAFAIVAVMTPATFAGPRALSGNGTLVVAPEGLRVDDGLAPPGNPNPRVLPPNSHAYGKSYADWGVEWWRWALSFPVSSNPIFDPTGAFNEQGQTGHVFFLAGNAGGALTRSVTVPNGTAIFFPLITFDVTYPCPDPTFVPGPGQTLEQFLQSVGDFYMGLVGPMTAELDGRSLTDLFSYRAQSRLSTVTGDPSLTAAFDACITGSEQPFVSDGYWLMLAPLPPGPHTLHFTSGIPDFGFSIEMTYNLDVLQRHHGRGNVPNAAIGPEAAPLVAPVSSWGRLKILYR